ncbi:MAG TPA: hypothetical protein VL068_04510, partial [Microthrixaceae bacterium]|nr:hypothetical protein [Microthrixaceae bacterium]
MVLESFSQFLGVVKDLLDRSWHLDHLKYLPLAELRSGDQLGSGVERERVPDLVNELEEGVHAQHGIGINDTT